MLFRAIVLSVALLIGLGTIIPIATEHAEAGAKKVRKYKKKSRNWRGVKKYSKRWWQLYRAQERRKRIRAANRRKLRLRQIRLARQRSVEKAQPAVAVKARTSDPDTQKATLPNGTSAPTNWKTGGVTPGEVKFRVDDNGSELGSASISVIGPATGETVSTGKNRTVGGVPTTSLRRDVINRMIRENGWVVNDYQKDIAGKKVYVVVAQSQNPGGRVNSRLFYFTEVNGRIYSVATNSGTGSADRIAEESEKVIHSLQGRTSGIQQASKE